MIKLLILSLIGLSSIAFAQEQIYLSSKKDEEMVSKLFEITRRVDNSTRFGAWRQDMMKNITLDCALQTKVLNTKRNIILPNENYSPVLRKEDILYLNALNIKVGTYSSTNLEGCYKIATTNSSEVFSHCYLTNILPEDSVLSNDGYPKEYLIVDSNFANGSKVTAGMYCDGIKNDKSTRQFTTTKGSAVWTVQPKYTKVNFGRWQENLMVGTTMIEFEGFKMPTYLTTIMK